MARFTRKMKIYTSTVTKKITENDKHRLEMERRREEEKLALALLSNWRAA